MYDKDKRRFQEKLNAVYQSHNKPVPEKPVVREFYEALAKYDIELVIKGFESHARDVERGRYLPKPADIVYQIRRLYRPPQFSSPASFGDGERWKELSKVTAAMMKEGPDGPITKATLAGKLSKGFVQNKSSEEIIEFCKGLYG